jgi:hypothetical protein
MIRRVVCIALGLFLGSSAALQAAQPYGAYGGCGGYGGAWWSDYYMGLAHRQEIPHFALYPPVYYSLPVPRTYGYSPFAYPPTVMTPEVVEDKSETIINPHVPQQPDAEEKPTAMRVTSAVRMIANPYVVSDAALADVTAK